jgi:3-hydroxy acid dehydrogenase / malonic semialdehyde reductase
MVVLITGASSGIGAATARAFAFNGVRLVLAARRLDRLQRLAYDLAVETHLVQLDVRDRTAVHHAIAALPARFADIDVLVNNAGLSRGLEPFHRACEDDWEEMIDTNIKGLLFVSRAVLPGMVERRHGHLINVGSVAGSETYPGGNVYCASKAAVRTVNKAMRLDLLGTGVRVSCVHPGLVPTEFSEVRFHGDRERAGKVYENTRPLSASDVAATIVWCVSQPAWVNVEDVLVMPTDQAAATSVHRRPLTAGEQRPDGSLAERWLAAWNSHDVAALLDLYAPEARHTSNRIRTLGGNTDTLVGHETIADYFRRGIERYPALRFEPLSVSTGLRTVAIEYNASGLDLAGPIVEILEVDDQGLITHSRVYQV